MIYTLMINTRESDRIFYTVERQMFNLKTDLRPRVPIDVKQEATQMSVWANCSPQVKLYVKAEDIVYEDEKNGSVCVVVNLDDFKEMYKKTKYFDAFMSYDYYYFYIEFWTEKPLEK